MAVKNYFLVLIIFLLITSFRRQPDIYAPTDIATSQTMPPDMVFVKGDGNIPSFYMGVTEECNINYEIYENWLERIYVDCPEAPAYAVPKSRDIGDLLHFNDPYYSYYQNHEAFAYYPIVGLTWVQAMNYLQWKSDRLNEKILFEIGVHDEKDMLNQANEQNFHTESYLCGQYYGLVKKDLRDVSPGGTSRKVSYSDGILFPTMRLPTEAEWDHAVASMSEKPINPLTYADPFSRKALYPYGKDYYTFIFGRTGGLKFDSLFEKGLEYHYKCATIPAVPDRLMGAGDFLLDEPGIANLAGNVPEWLMDEYAEQPAYKGTRFIDYFSKYAMPVLEDSFVFAKIFLETYFYQPHPFEKSYPFLEKDSLGKMYFNIFGIEKNASKSPALFGRYKSVQYKYLGDKNIYLDTTIHTIIPVNINTQKEPGIGTLGNLKNFEGVESIPITNLHYDWPSSGYYTYSLLYKGNKTPISVQKDSIGYYCIESQFTTYYPDTITRYRLVKGGSWKQPDANARQQMKEDDASSNVGFRCVITYNSLPVKNKYKVKWR